MSAILKAATRLISGVLILAVSMGAKAHVVLKEATAQPRSYYVATFRVPHGCGVSPTIALRVTIPPEILIAKPMPKPGWHIKMTDESLPQPVTGEHKILTGRTAEITWSGGPLPSDYFDEFSIMVFLPARTGPLYFPTVQVCEEGEIRWVDVPSEGKTSKDMPFPAPTVTLVPVPGSNEHKE